MEIETGLPISKVRDAEFSETDEKRASDALRELCEAANGFLDEITLTDAQCCEIISMLQSQEYFRRIASITPDVE